MTDKVEVRTVEEAIDFCCEKGSLCVDSCNSMDAQNYSVIAGYLSDYLMLKRGLKVRLNQLHSININEQTEKYLKAIHRKSN